MTSMEDDDWIDSLLKDLDDGLTRWEQSAEREGEALELGLFNVPMTLHLEPCTGVFVNKHHEAELRLLLQPRKGAHSDLRGRSVAWTVYGHPQGVAVARGSVSLHPRERRLQTVPFNLNAERHGWRPCGACWFVLEARYVMDQVGVRISRK